MPITPKQIKRVEFAEKGDKFGLLVLKELDKLEADFKEKVSSIREDINNKKIETDVAFASIKLKKGDDGHTPTDDELLTLIKPLIPESEKGDDGDTPTAEELLKLIRPLIPEVKDGETPTDDRLIELIKPLIPEPIPGADGSSDTPEMIRSKLETLEGEEKLHISDIYELEEELKKRDNRERVMGGGGLSKIALESKFIDDETPSGTINGTNKVFTIKNTPNPPESLKVYIGGVRMRVTEDYTFSGQTITFIIAPMTTEILLVDYRV